MKNKWKWTVVWACAAVFYFLVLWDFYQAYILVGNPPSLGSKRFVIFLATLPLHIVFCGYWLWAILSDHFPYRLFRWLAGFLKRINPAIRLLGSLVIILIPAYYLLYSPLGDYHPGYWFRLGLLAVFSIIATFVLFPQEPDLPWLLRLAACFMTAGAIFTTIDWLNDVTSYPFSLSWSEGNRMWDYSMLFGSSRYINPTGKPIFTFIETGRQFLWAIPFLIPNLSIFAFRLWNALVWILPPAILGTCSVAGKTSFKRGWLWQAVFIIWAYLFLSQGPIYSPLLLSAALVVVAVRQKNLLLAMILTALAAYYCRESRWTWMYAPGLWAGLLALLNQENPSFSSAGWKKLIPSVALGIAGFIGGQYLSPLITFIFSGYSPSITAGATITLPDLGVQAMLWDRLFPNPTYPPGILLGIAWVGLPAVGFIFGMWKTKLWRPNWLQAASTIVLLGIFLGLGIVVSTKIGGGSNLHNLDMLLTTVVLVAGLLFKRWMDNGLPDFAQKREMIVYLVIAMILPATVIIQYGEPMRLPPNNLTQNILASMQTEVETAKVHGPVLFIDQRQLLTFGYIKNVPLVADYEKKFLMDQCLSGNQTYLNEFEQKLAEKTYSLIVTEPISGMMADEGLKNFAEENNAWVEWVSRPLVKYYQPILTDKTIGVQLLIPRN